MALQWQRKAQLKKKLSDLPKAIEEAVRGAMEEGAQALVEKMRSLAPVDEGKLRDSINWCWGAPPKGARFVTSVSAPKGAEGINSSHITIFAGDDEAFYARWVEFGTKAHAPGKYRDERTGHKRSAGEHGHKATPARPFFYTTWRAEKKKMRARMSRKINAAIKKIAGKG